MESDASNPTLTIRSRADLGRLNQYSRNGSKSGFRQIKLEIPSLTSARLAAKEEKLNRLYFACGCSEASAFGIAGLAGAIAWIFIKTDEWSGLQWTDFVYAFGAFILATGIGKWFGRLRARHAFEIEVSGLRHHLADDRSGHQLPRAVCGVM